MTLSELVFIGLLSLILFGPKELPKVFYAFGIFFRWVQEVYYRIEEVIDQITRNRR